MTFEQLQALIESNAKAIQAISNQMAEIATDIQETRIDLREMRAISDSNARAIQAGSNETANLREAARSLFASQQQLTTAYIGFTETISQYITRTDQRLERLERTQ